jgi:organic radical activating enzyme
MVDSLPLMEAFYTIQCEGYHQGKAAVFIRLAGCDVGCHWCDVKESWDPDDYKNQPVEKIVEKVKHFKSDVVVITGGEPLMYNLDSLTEHLISAGFKTHLETSGVYPLSGKWDWICLSPKKFKQPLTPIYNIADELKVIIYNKNDFKWAESLTGKLKQACKLYFQPEWGKSDEMIPLMVEYIKHNPEWKISLQIHKYMNIP